MILWSVVDSQLASSEPFREPPGPVAGRACGRAKVVTAVPQTPAAERVHDARASPHRYCWLATGPHPRPPERHAHPQQRIAGAGVRPVLRSTLQRSAPHPAGGGATISRCAASLVPADYALVTPGYLDRSGR